MYKMKWFFLMITLLISPLVFAVNEVKLYEPSVVILNGTIELKTFPGAPNYEDVNKGDVAETGPYLILSHPIDVLSTKSQDEINTPEKNVTMIQIVCHDPAELKKLTSKQRVSIVGTLFHQVSGHHHTKVLINAQKVIEATN